MNHASKPKPSMDNSNLVDSLEYSKNVSADGTVTSNQSAAYSESYFDALYNDNTDPWDYQTRWYEKRKRDMCLAILPQSQYDNAIELGCGNGVLSELLAQRCQALLSIDGNHQAVKLAKERLAELSHIKVIQGVIPNRLLTLKDAVIEVTPAVKSVQLNLGDLITQLDDNNQTTPVLAIYSSSPFES